MASRALAGLSAIFLLSLAIGLGLAFSSENSGSSFEVKSSILLFFWSEIPEFFDGLLERKRLPLAPSGIAFV